jgi:asparagine synthase (glutamine-hydrolysing)
MCGIAGFVNFEGHRRPEAAARIKRMTDTLIHRGPDGEGYFVDQHVAFGHRRLAIIDLASGQQPMSVLDGMVQIAFNGEIYNFIELRSQLEAHGHSFLTRSDTEVILHAYLEWGEYCVERLSGMFAFALWDTRCRRLLLVRDRVGKKPLYYWRDRDVIAFASELKALRAGALCPAEIDPEALDCYLTLGYISAPRTIYSGVRKVPAAHVVSITPQTQAERRYWTLSFAQPKAMSLDEAADELEVLLDDAVRCRLMSEVPLGAFLSGGIDSSLVVSSMARLTDRPVITNSIGFDDHEFSEQRVAARIAQHLGTNHHEFVVTPRATEVLERIAWHFDEPLADSSAVPTWYVCEMARRSVTVALSGDGGDEGFGGYTYRYTPHIVESKVRKALPAVLREPLFGGLGTLWPASAQLPKPLRLKTIFENLAASDTEAFYRDLVCLRPGAREKLYSPDFLGGLQGFTPMETVAPYYLRNDAPDVLGRCQFADLHSYMTDDVLVKVDRMSMAHSLEVRCPLLDHRILEFAARLPSALKMNARQGKLLLRRLATRRLPPEIARLPKRGFSIPANRWLRGELRPMVEDLVFGRREAFADVLNMSRLSQAWREHLSGAADHQVLFWGLMMLQLWSHTNAPPRRSAATDPDWIAMHA